MAPQRAGARHGVHGLQVPDCVGNRGGGTAFLWDSDYILVQHLGRHEVLFLTCKKHYFEVSIREKIY